MAVGKGARLTVDVLGPVRAVVDDEPVDLGRTQVRRLLAVLAAHADGALDPEAAVEQLWPGDEQPADPRAALRVVVSRLRSSLGERADRLTSGPDGLRLRPDHSDLGDFTTLVDRARDADDAGQEAELLADALALWRDRPFRDVPGPPLLDEVARGLEETRWFARTRLVEALQEMGEHEHVVEAATSWAAAEPGRERLVVNLSRSLAATGDKAKALATLEATRRYLRDQVGVDPSDLVTETERDILTGGVQLGDREGRRHRAIPDIGSEPVGREAEIADLLAATGTTVLVGEPGIGKSTVLAAFEGRATAEGRHVVTVAAAETPQAPLEPVAELVGALIAGDLTALDPALRHRLFPDPDDDGERIGALSRESLVHQCADALRAGAPSPATVLVVDDAHWLDGLSAEVLAAAHRDGGVTLVLGTRPGGPLPPLLADAERITLGPLTADAVAEILADALPRQATRELADDLHRRSGGNPLFVRLLLDELADGGDPGRLPSTVLVAVQQRLDDLRRRSVRDLEVAAVLGPTFDLAYFAALRPEGEDALEEAAEADLVDLGPGRGRAAFTHALVAESIYDLIAPARRVDLHDEVGRVLEAEGAPVAEYAAHFEAAAAIAPTRAVAALLQAGEVFAAAFTWDLARSFFERALAVHREQRRADDELSAAALIGLGAVLRTATDPASAEVLLTGARLARDLGLDTVFARGVVELCSHGRTLAAGQVDDAAGDLLDAALALELPPALRAELCAAAAVLLSQSEEHARSRQLYLEAFAAAQDLADPTVEMAVLMPAHLGLSHPDDFSRRVVAADRLAALGADDIDLTWEATFLRAGTALVTGDGATLWSSLDRLRELTPLVVARPRSFGLAFTETAAALVTDDFDAAEAHLEHTLAEGLARYPESWVMSVYSSLLLGIRKAQGRIGELTPVVEGLLADAPGFPTWRVIAAVAALDNGDRGQARHHWGHLRQGGLATLIPDHTWTAAMGFAGELAVALEDDDSARVVYDALLPHAGLMQWVGTCTYGPVDDVLAALADHFGRPDEAAARRTAAAELRRGLLPAR